MNNRKPTLLTLSLGYFFDDLGKVGKQLSLLHINREVINLFHKAELQKAIELIKADKVDAIETRHLRYWQENLDKVKPILDTIEKFSKEHSIPMLNSPEIFRWIGNKAKYLSELERKGIAIVPSTFVKPEDQFDIASYIVDRKDGLVIKPSFAAKAYGLEFIKHSQLKEKPYSIESPKEITVDNAAYLDKKLVTKTELLQHFQDYLKKQRNNDINKDQIIIVQDIIPEKIEFSCMLLRGCNPYYIKRLEGTHSGIAHEAFGGENKVEDNPKSDLIKFAEQVKEALPENIKDEPILRVDILVCKNNELLLLEIEAASLRLFTTENNLNQYSAMLAMVSKKSYDLFCQTGSRNQAVTSTLAPSYKILPRTL